MPRVLGVDVARALIDSWVRWLAPDPQPFVVASRAVWRQCTDEGGELSEELADTYRVWWGVKKPAALLWLSETQFAQLPRPTRAALVREQADRGRGAVPSVRAWRDLLDADLLRRQADGHRFVWWPSLVERAPVEILNRVVSTERLPSRHREVDDSTWRAAAKLLPRVRRLSGTFPTGSNVNCFGAVLAAAGADGGAAYSDVRPFEAWLRARCTRGGDAREPGVVMVWRDGTGRPIHSAVAIGGGWGFEKPSKDWHSPLAVLTVGEIMRMSRHPGERVERHTIVGNG